MECVCGYAHYNEWELHMKKEEGIEYIQGDKSFIRSTTSVYWERDYGSNKSSYIYICPECGTLKVDL